MSFPDFLIFRKEKIILSYVLIFVSLSRHLLLILVDKLSPFSKKKKNENKDVVFFNWQKAEKCENFMRL